MKTVKDRFLKYVSFDTQSQDGVEEVPSTAKQLELAKFLVEELNELGLSEVELLDHGYVFATLPATTEVEFDGDSYKTAKFKLKKRAAKGDKIK